MHGLENFPLLLFVNESNEKNTKHSSGHARLIFIFTVIQKL